MIEIGETESSVCGRIKFFVKDGELGITYWNYGFRSIEREMYEKEGDVYFSSSFFQLFQCGADIKIPKYVIDSYDREKARYGYESHYQRIGWATTALGHIDFLLSDEGSLVCKVGDQSFEADTLHDVFSRKCMCTPGLGCGYVEVPEDVAMVFLNQKEQTASLHTKLIYVGTSPLNGMEYYRLNHRLPSDEWSQVMRFFQFFSSDLPTCKLGEFRGWLTCQPQTVERTLGIASENTIRARSGEINSERAKFEKLSQDITEKLEYITSAFEEADYPDPELSEEAGKYQVGFEKITLTGGESIPHPWFPEVEQWLITSDEIWNLQFNGGQYNNWEESNVLINGASAIGLKLPYTEDLADTIRSFKDY